MKISVILIRVKEVVLKYSWSLDAVVANTVLWWDVFVWNTLPVFEVVIADSAVVELRMKSQDSKIREGVNGQKTFSMMKI